jgi:signal transduction histidine kinase
MRLTDNIKKYLSIYVNNGYDFLQNIFVMVALLSSIFHVVFYFFLTYGFNLTDSLFLRATVSILTASILFIPKNKKLKIYHILFYEIIVSISLPVLFNTFFILNDFHIYWNASLFFAAFIFGMIVSPVKTLLLWPFAFLLSLFITYSYYGIDLSYNQLLQFFQVNVAAYFLLFITGIIQIVLTQSNIITKRLNDQIQKQNQILNQQKQLIENQNQELTELVQTKDKFFSIISHDLKNSFNAITNLSELLYTKHMDIDHNKKEKFYELIYKTSLSTFDLFNNLVFWSQIQTNRIQFTPEHFSIKTIINQTIESVKANAVEKDIELIITNDIEENIHADVNIFQTVLRNFLTNAIKYTKNGGNIEIKLFQQNETIRVSVKDNGIGMNDEQLNSLFDITKKISEPGTNEETGTGLGLLLCKELVEIHNGRIEIKSTPEVGSEFIMIIPENKYNKRKIWAVK